MVATLGRLLVGALFLVVATTSLSAQERVLGEPFLGRLATLPFFQNSDPFAALDAVPSGPPSELAEFVQFDVRVTASLLVGVGQAPPEPMLRLTRMVGEPIRADLFLWWFDAYAGDLPQRFPDHRCVEGMAYLNGKFTSICLAKVRLPANVDWAQFLGDLFGSRACAFKFSDKVTVVDHTDRLIARWHDPKTGRYEEYSCQIAARLEEPGGRQAASVVELLKQWLDAALLAAPR